MRGKLLFVVEYCGEDDMRIVLDTYGADQGAEVFVEGAKRALLEMPELSFLFVGDEEKLTELLQGFPNDKGAILRASDVIDNTDDPISAIRSKPDSSMVVALKELKAGEVDGMLSAGKITEAEYVALEDTACPGCGSCSYLGTANTMCALSEALGMTLPDGGTAPAVSAARLAKGEETGIKIMELVEKRITARKVITEGSIRNAIKACLAMSGSTNAVMHLTAIAHEAQIDMDVLSEFDSLSRTTPQLAKMNPACKYNIVDFYKDGGVPRLMENLQTLLDTGVMTVTGQTLEENIKTHHYLYPATGLVNHTLDDPFGYSGGVAVLRGNLAPDTGVTKPGAFDKSLHHFEGEAICFDSEEEAEEAILAGKIHEGHVVVIRYEGPKGGPGMREMYKAMKYLYGRGLSKSTALITDGRFSGTNNGCFVGHISPEAAEGGPIAIVRDGDRICIDVEKRQLDLLVSQEEIEARLKDWKRPAPKFTSGWLGLYCKLAASGSKGAIMDLNKLKDL